MLLVEVAVGTGVKQFPSWFMQNQVPFGGSLLGCPKTAHFKVRVCMAVDRHVPELGDVTFNVTCQG